MKITKKILASVLAASVIMSLASISAFADTNTRLGGGTVLLDEDFENVTSFTTNSNSTGYSITSYRGTITGADVSMYFKESGVDCTQAVYGITEDTAVAGITDDGHGIAVGTTGLTGNYSSLVIPVSELETGSDAGLGVYLVEYDIYSPSGMAVAGVKLNNSLNTAALARTDFGFHAATAYEIKTFMSGNYLNEKKDASLTDTYTTIGAWTRHAYIYDSINGAVYLYENGQYKLGVTCIEENANYTAKYSKDIVNNKIDYFNFGSYGAKTNYFDNIKITKLDEDALNVVAVSLLSTASTSTNFGAVRDTIEKVNTATESDACTYLAMTAFNVDTAPKRADYIVALYSEGTLVNTMSGTYVLTASTEYKLSDTKNIIKSKTGTQTFCICDVLTDEVDEIKLYVWDSISGTIPMYESVTIK